MRTSRLILSAVVSVFIVGIILVVNGSVSKRDTIEHNETRLRYKSCELYESSKREISCFYYRTHENGGFSLPLAIISNASEIPIKDRDLIVLLGGGPGQGFMTAPEELQAWAAKLERDKVQADFLVYDPRGTGDGEGAVQCEAYQNAVRDLLQLQMEPKKEVSILNDRLESCIDIVNKQLTNIGMGATSFQTGVFSTYENVNDLEGILGALEYQKVHLLGVSYGSRLALAASRLNKVKTLVLDSPYPLDKGSERDMVQNIVNTLDLHESLFSTFYPNASYKSVFINAVDKLKSHTLSVPVVTWNEGENIDFQLSAHRLIDLSIHVLYSAYLYSNYYEGLMAYVEKQTISEEFRMVLEHFVSTVVDPSFNTMVYFSTECTDNIEGDITDIAALIADNPVYEEYVNVYVGNSPCQFFEEIDSLKVNALDIADKPTIAFSGKYDPVTPNAWAIELNAQHAQMELIQFNDAGHAPLTGGRCDLSFLNDLTSKLTHDVKVDCSSDTEN